MTTSCPKQLHQKGEASRAASAGLRRRTGSNVPIPGDLLGEEKQSPVKFTALLHPVEKPYCTNITGGWGNKNGRRGALWSTSCNGLGTGVKDGGFGITLAIWFGMVPINTALTQLSEVQGQDEAAGGEGTVTAIPTTAPFVCFPHGKMRVRATASPQGLRGSMNGTQPGCTAH